MEKELITVLNPACLYPTYFFRTHQLLFGIRQDHRGKFDGFLRTGRRFSYLIEHPLILRSGLRVAVANQFMANMTLQVMGNLVDNSTPGAAGRVLRIADKALATADQS